MDNKRAMGNKSERVSLGTLTSSDGVLRTIEKITSQNARGDKGSSKKDVRGSWTKH
ncbi:MAG: hypothetical protein RBT05_03090 [Bacteroidales bacterium]|nr:hypothetical protein [Bacteroidales bacterium]